MKNRILIIDDDAELRQELEEILDSEGFFAETVSNGDAGMALLKKNTYYALILDYRLPNSSGIDVLRFIKDGNIKSKIFVITGKPFIEKLLKEEGLDDIVTCVLSKPFPVNTLLKQIKA